MSNYEFKKLFDFPTTFSPADQDLNDLAEFMAKKDPAKSKIPAGYTYFAQFVDHDLTLDSGRNTNPWLPLATPIFNVRNPAFDLETLYGVDEKSKCPNLAADGVKLNLSETSFDMTSKIKRGIKHDLPRKPRGSAFIFDERNDENLLVAQTHVAFMIFHNTIADRIEGANPAEKYENTRRKVIRYYQYIIFNDLLPRIIKAEVLTDVLANGNKFYKPKDDDLFMPLEFSVGAFRSGHSSVRNTYHVNSLEKGNLSNLSSFTGRAGMMGRKTLPTDWLIDWNLFYDLKGDGNLPESFNFALKFDTDMASGLGNTRGTVGFSRESSILALDLYRARQFGLPPGQLIASAMNIQALDSQVIAAMLPPDLQNKFNNETPPWFYFLAEAQHDEDGETLGEAGSRIVAEFFLELLRRSPSSIIEPGTVSTLNFPSADDFLDKELTAPFGMPEILNYIERNNPGFIDPVNA